jgi:hypothetical protein
MSPPVLRTARRQSEAGDFVGVYGAHSLDAPLLGRPLDFLRKS